MRSVLVHCFTTVATWDDGFDEDDRRRQLPEHVKGFAPNIFLMTYGRCLWYECLLCGFFSGWSHPAANRHQPVCEMVRHNYLKLISPILLVILCIIKNSTVIFSYPLVDEPTRRATLRRDWLVLIDLKLQFNSHANYLMKPCMCTVGVICWVTSSFTKRPSLFKLYRALSLH